MSSSGRAPGDRLVPTFDMRRRVPGTQGVTDAIKMEVRERWGSALIGPSVMKGVPGKLSRS